jgi:flagellar M-ring protein FliF
VEKKIGDMIASTLGPGHAAVTVSAELDMSKSRSTTQTFQRPSVTGTTRATTDIPLEQNNTTETLTQNGPDGTGGQLGVGNPDSRTTVGGAGPTNYNKTTTQQRNALDSTQITAETPPGTVRRMSVSVLLDRAVVDAGSVTQTWIPQITAAAGILPNRDGANAVQVQSIDFNTEAIKAAQPTPPAGGPNAMFDLVKHVLTLAMIGLILFFAWKAIKRAEANRVPLRVPLDLRELEAPEYASVGAHVAGTPIGGANRRPLEPPPPTIEGELTDLIERQPDEVAQTLRSWLADRRG